MTNNVWQRVTWDEDENVTGPEFLIQQGATWPVLVRFESGCGYVNKTVTNRYNLWGEEKNYISVMVAPVVWPVEVGNE
jgi:hypothetical protein